MDDVLAKHELYSMMIQQLQADGYGTVAQQLKVQSGDVSLNAGPSSQLFDRYKDEIRQKPIITKAYGPGLNLEAPVPPAELQVEFVQKASLSQSSPCQSFAFSNDGSLFAVGLSSGKIIVYSTEQVAFQAELVSGTTAIVATFSENSAAISDLAFHPTLPVLAAASHDKTIRIFKLDGAGVGQAVRTIEEACSVNSISFHPSGYFLAVACEHVTPRLYNTETWQCYRPPSFEDEHSGPIVKLAFSSDGSQLISCCRAGSVKLWSAVSLRCLKTFSSLFGSTPITFVQFSSNDQYVLVSSLAGKLILLDLDKGHAVASYQSDDTQTVTCPAVFGANDDVIIWTNDQGSVVVWNTRLEQQANVDSSHATPLSALCYSSSRRVLLSAGTDRTVRCWVHPGSNVVKTQVAQAAVEVKTEAQESTAAEPGVDGVQAEVEAEEVGTNPSANANTVEQDAASSTEANGQSTQDGAMDVKVE
eukprot:m.178798 g.178798  ORF g.178798 m.178798 type:complete len:474 (+) comp16842_c0_seq21:57-1478(+)